MLEQYIINALWYLAYSPDDEKIFLESGLEVKEIKSDFLEELTSAMMPSSSNVDRFGRTPDKVFQDTIGYQLIKYYEAGLITISNPKIISLLENNDFCYFNPTV